MSPVSNGNVKRRCRAMAKAFGWVLLAAAWFSFGFYMVVTIVGA